MINIVFPAAYVTVVSFKQTFGFMLLTIVIVRKEFVTRHRFVTFARS